MTASRLSATVVEAVSVTGQLLHQDGGRDQRPDLLDAQVVGESVHGNSLVGAQCIRKPPSTVIVWPVM